MLEYALNYAGRGWRVFPAHTTIGGACSCGRSCGKDAGKHPRIKEWQKAATTDPAQIHRWWSKWPEANIAIACGSGLVVIDLDGAEEIAAFTALARASGGLPETLVCRTARGLHLYLAGDWGTTKKVPTVPGDKSTGILVRGTGGYVIAPPSYHASGHTYAFVKPAVLAPLPDWMKEWLQSAENASITTTRSGTLLPGQTAPSYLHKPQQKQSLIRERLSSALRQVPTPHEIARIRDALKAIPADCARDQWLHIGMGLHALGWDASDGGDLGFELWREWSETGKEKFQGLHDLETRWQSFGRTGRSGITLGTLYHIAEQHGWQGLVPQVIPREEVRPHPEHNSAAPHPIFGVPTSESGGAQPYRNGHASADALLGEGITRPQDAISLGNMNARYACIGDVGGKCMVMGWVPSKADPTVEIPSFQTFKSFAERYGHIYVTTTKEGKDGAEIEEAKQIGAFWLKWRKRRTYDAIDMLPGQPAVVGQTLNLWRGMAVQPAPGSWERMKAHIGEVLAGGSAPGLEYIMKWSAWSVQNPDKRAESALVFRGSKGSGKGTFAHALRRLFGAHGLHISNSKHLVGAFNAHLRNCLLLYSDEAFWAGDKQGESTLKALITEPTLTIEQKGVDAVQWHNRIHLIMTANAEWVVPASHDERRYAVFNVSEKYRDNEAYFRALHDEIENGGLSAMLYDLQRVQLGDWHPRKIIKTEALTQQKIQSMTPLQEWWEAILQDGAIPFAPKESPDSAMAIHLLNHAREFAPRLRDLNASRLGRFLADHGCVKLHKSNGNAWRFATLAQCRSSWERYFQGWKWDESLGEWGIRQP